MSSALESEVSVVGAGVSDEQRQSFLLRVAELLSRYGTPSHRLERVVVRMAEALGVKVACLYTPTSLILSFDEGPKERTRLLRVDAGETNLGKLVDFDEVLEDLEHGRTDLERARERLELLEAAPPRYRSPQIGLACAVASAGATLFLGGGVREIGVSAVLGGFIFAVGWALERLPTSRSLFEPLAGFLAAVLSLAIGRWVMPMDDRVATLGALIILLPGLSFTVGMTELATRHLVAGTARIAGAAATFLLLTLGVALAWRLAGSWRLSGVVLEAPPDWAWPVSVGLVPLAFAVLLQARRSEWLVIMGVAAMGFLAATSGGRFLGREFGPFLGALSVGMIANSYARWIDRPALVAQIPGILILVPGSVGYRSLTAFVESQTVQGLELAFNMTLVAMSLVGGVLAANVVIPPKRIL